MKKVKKVVYGICGVLGLVVGLLARPALDGFLVENYPAAHSVVLKSVMQYAETAVVLSDWEENHQRLLEAAAVFDRIEEEVQFAQLRAKMADDPRYGILEAVESGYEGIHLVSIKEGNGGVVVWLWLDPNSSQIMLSQEDRFEQMMGAQAMVLQQLFAIGEMDGVSLVPDTAIMVFWSSHSTVEGVGGPASIISADFGFGTSVEVWQGWLENPSWASFLSLVESEAGFLYIPDLYGSTYCGSDCVLPRLGGVYPWDGIEG